MKTDSASLENLPAALDLAIFERTSRGLFRPLGELPRWMPLDAGHEVDLADRFPLLELFLADCAPVFDTGSPASMESDVWQEANGEGSEDYLQARAIRFGERNLIVVKSLPHELFTYQQLFHEVELAKEEAQRQKRIADRATQAKSDFLAAMSHEIRTPLNAIIGMADVLSATPLTAEQHKCVEIFQRNGVALLNLINDILDLSKVESGKVELESVRMDLREVVARAVEVVEGRAHAKGLEIEVELSPHIPMYMTGDPNRLRQILINLLGNSIKFTERGGLRVRVEQNPEDARAGFLRFAVADTGVGIPEDKLGLIFESFSQADSSVTRKYGGTGLGLSISRQLVELMRGRIWVESKVGEGSTFFFTAQLRVEEDQSEPMPASGSLSTVAPERRVDGLRILLADDSEDNRFLIQSYLKEAYCSIQIASNGQEALDRFQNGSFDVVLMDVEMPVMDGLSATQIIRDWERDRQALPTPVIALTAHAFAEMRDRWRHAGFTAYLTKPLRKATLIDALAECARMGAAMELESGPPAAPLTPGLEPPTRISVGKGMEAVVPAYLERRRREVQSYRDALARGDFESIRMLGHKMRGTGGGYGFPLLTELGRVIEDAALRQDRREVDAAVERLARYVETVQLDYAEETSQSI
jgi:signal transduction histidine kinase/CheY-like chemotaxis protein/HPt (histidine-containing phosphotransfer) domain-containing protein